jgi:hypothetical protein
MSRPRKRRPGSTTHSCRDIVFYCAIGLATGQGICYSLSLKCSALNIFSELGGVVMQRRYVVGASALALGVALGSTPALAGPAPAARGVSVPVVADYNAAQVKAAGDIVTVNPGLATYTVGTGTLEVNSRFTVTLPTGFSFSSQPALTGLAPTTFVLSSGGIGAQSATFTVTTAPQASGTVGLLGFAVQGATALETPIPVAAALPITMQSTNNSQIDNNDAKPLSAKAFASEPGIAVTPDGELEFIDLSSPTLGTLFGSGGADTTTVAIVDLTIGAETNAPALGPMVLSPDGQGNMLATTDTATITVFGAFNGITGAFAATDDSCAKASATGTVTPSEVSIPGVSLGSLSVCIVADGTSLLQQDLQGFSVTVAPGTSTDFLGTATTADSLITYTGGGVINVTNFFTGDDAGYSSLLRVNNAGSAASNIFALVQPDTGGAPLTGSLGSVGGGAGTVFSEAQVAAAVSGLDLANSGQRATLQLIVSGADFSQVKASSFLVNPGGVVDNVGVQPNTVELR